MKILVTGGLGFIGKHLVRRLRELNHTVYFCDLKHYNDYYYRRCDISSFRQIKNIIDTTEPDIVYHLAAEFGRRNGEDFYETLWRTNVIGTKNIIRLQEYYHFKMIFASSSEVYGDYSDRNNLMYIDANDDFDRIRVHVHVRVRVHGQKKSGQYYE